MPYRNQLYYGINSRKLLSVAPVVESTYNYTLILLSLLFVIRALILIKIQNKLKCLTLTVAIFNVRISAPICNSAYRICFSQIIDGNSVV